MNQDYTEDDFRQLFSVCAAMDEISGKSTDFLSLLERESEDEALEDDELYDVAGGIKPFLPKEE